MNENLTITTGTLVRSGKRLGRVVVTVRNKALVMWEKSNVAAWNRVANLRIVF